MGDEQIERFSLRLFGWEMRFTNVKTEAAFFRGLHGVLVFACVFAFGGGMGFLASLVGAPAFWLLLVVQSAAVYFWLRGRGRRETARLAEAYARPEFRKERED